MSANAAASAEQRITTLLMLDPSTGKTIGERTVRLHNGEAQFCGRFVENAHYSKSILL